MSNSNEIIDMELEAIKAIYLDDININVHNLGSNETNIQYLADIQMNILPKTADQTSDQFVKLMLSIHLPELYPNQIPVFQFNKTRGLTDERLVIIRDNIEMICRERLGETMVYDMIEKCRDLLTTFNFPTGNRCSVCLYDFTNEDQIIKNECFHHLHSRCFSQYVLSLNNCQQINSNNDRVISSEIKVDCPVCRTRFDTSNICSYLNPDQYSAPFLSKKPLKDEILIIEDAKQKVKNFNDIYLKQLKSGGIIDEELERNKFFIRISDESNQTTDS